MIETLLVTTKAFDAVQAIASVQHKLQQAATIVILSNGALAIQEAIKDDNVSLGTITHGVYRDVDDNDDMHSIVHAGMGDIRLEGHLNAVSSILDQSGLSCQTDVNIRTILWKKLAANCVINPLTSQHRCLNGDLEQHVEGFASTVVPEIIQEVYNVFCSCEGKDFSAKEMDEWQNYVLTVVKNTASNQSSMLHDVKMKQNTEIEFLNGFVVRKAKRLGLACERNADLVNFIKTLDSFEP